MTENRESPLSAEVPILEGQVLTGPLFSEPMRVETVRSDGPGVWVAGLVGQRSGQFRRVTLTSDDYLESDHRRRRPFLRRRRAASADRPPGLFARHRLRVRSLFRAFHLARGPVAAPARSGLRAFPQAPQRALPARRRCGRGQDHHGRPLDSLLAEPGAIYEQNVLSVEHVLPQTPEEGSVWLDWFPDPEQREMWTHRLANLVLLSRRKNSQAQNFDFERKKNEYFQRNGVATFAITLQVLQRKDWTPDALAERQEELTGRLAEEWRL